MSDLNDDLLSYSYEIGDDLDDNDLAVDDEDILLLSDEETPSTKLSQQEEALLLEDDDLLNFPKTETKDDKGKSKIGESTSISATVETTKSTQIETVNNVKNENIGSVSNKQKVILTKSEKIPQKRLALKRHAITIGSKKPKQDVTCVEKVESIQINEPLLNQEQIIQVEENVLQETTVQESDDTKVSDSTEAVSETTVADINTKTSSLLQQSEKISETITETISSSPDFKSSDEQPPSSSQEASSSENISQECSSSVGLRDSTYSEDMDSDYAHRHNNAEFETEDSDDDDERLNAKTRVERDSEVTKSEFSSHGPPHQPFYSKPRGGIRPNFMCARPPPGLRFPNTYHPFLPHPGNENFNPQYQQHLPPFRQQLERPGNAQMRPPQFHSMHQQPPHPHGLRQPFDMNRPRLMGASGVPMHPHGHPIRGQQRPDFQHNSIPPFRPFNGNQQHRPAAPHNMNIGPHRMGLSPGTRPQQSFQGPHQQQPYAAGSSRSHPGNLFIQAPIQLQQQHNSPNNPVPGSASGSASVIPRKVLINPNFKGGVEAATNQLMMDTLNNPQYIAANNDAELLRQQEAFINQNRMHIEKRRHERTPDRERERSYTPPPRRERRYNSRERDIRKPYNSAPYRGGGGGGRGRRAGSKDNYGESGAYNNYSKRKRSTSLDRDNRNDKNDAEDDETRAYRLEIEKQKSMREKILKDKELRRRKAAEGKTEVPQEKKPEAQPNATLNTAKLTPIIVTEKKIISLKKKAAETTAQQSVSAQQQTQPAQSLMGQSRSVATAATSGQRQLPTAKIMPETKKPQYQAPPLQTMAVVKPHNVSDDKDQLDEYDEDELLADSPPPPLDSPQLLTATTSITRFSNRRVILKQSTNEDALQHKQQPTVVLNTSNLKSSPAEKQETTAIYPKTKGIFDRLDKKIGNEAGKRKIQRIFIKNTD